MGGDYFAPAWLLEELGKVDQSVAVTSRGWSVARCDARLPVRDRSPAAGMAAVADQWPGSPPSA